VQLLGHARNAGKDLAAGSITFARSNQASEERHWPDEIESKRKSVKYSRGVRRAGDRGYD
jgi:hypothetical protein